MATSRELSSLQKAAIALREMRGQLEALQQAAREPIAIVGMACRFPGSGYGLEAFWRDLRDGRDSITEVPPDRWNVDLHYHPDPAAPGKMYTRHGGFICDIDKFDPAFFGINAHEAARIDPQQRLVLETSWEALEHAVIAPDRLAGSKTGVYFGLMTADYLRLLMGDGRLDALDPFAAMANGLSFPAGRLSYTLGLQGPSMVVATACSSSLVALHLACQSLRSRECDIALAGGVNAILSPEMNVLLSKTRVLSPSGRSKAFDASADGYSRGEGCGVLVLMRLADAEQQRHHIWALVRGSAVNHCGMSGALTVPNGSAQQALILEALRNSAVLPESIGYVETHGTGTPLGDPIELHALDQVMRQGHSHDSPCRIGSVKTNIGHLEAAAGVAGIIKTVLALDREQIPPHLHFRAPTEHVQWNEMSLRVVDKLEPWPRTAQHRFAGVSSFGLSGINAHVVLEEAPVTPKRDSATERDWHVLTLSAKTESALRALAGGIAEHLEHNSSLAHGDVCFSLNTGRAALPWRLAVISTSVDEARRNLTDFLSGTPGPTVIAGHAAFVKSRMPTTPASHAAAALRTLCQEWVAGAAVDWRAFYANSDYRRVPLPSYPFERVRCWAIDRDLFARNADPVGLPAESEPLAERVRRFFYRVGWVPRGPAALLPAASALPDPAALYTRVSRVMPDLENRLSSELALYRDLIPRLEIFAAACAVDILRRLGWEFEISAETKLDALVTRCGIAPAYRSYVGRLLELAATAGYLTWDGDVAVVTAVPPQGDIEAAAQELAHRFPTGRIEVDLLARCALGTPRVLRGEMDPMELLFARGEESTLENFYRHSAAYGALNELIREVVACAVEQLPEERRLRVLETGAGTGATTSIVLPLLSANRVEYAFTDISPAFAAAAASRFGEHAGFRSAVFNLENPAPGQGFRLGTFDLILAVNVLHATSDLRRSTTHLLQLLAPDGLLLIVEGISPQGWLDIMFGLLPGWWNFRDRDLRPSHPLLSREKWLDLLREIGCRDVTAIPGKDQTSSLAVEIQQAVIVARAPLVQIAAPQFWLVFSDDGIEPHASRRLQSLGDGIIRVRPGSHFVCQPEGDFVVNPASRSDMHRLVAETLAANPAACAGIIYLWAAEEPPASSSPFEEKWQHRTCGGLLHLAASLAEARLNPPPRLTLATSGAVAVGDPTEPLAPHQATVWGLGRVIASELPELRCSLIDLGGESAEDAARALVDELSIANTPDSPEPLVAIRGGERHTGVLKRCPEVGGTARAQFSPDATYALAGGTGGLGALTVEWMAGRGARHFAVVSRRPPGEQFQQLRVNLERNGVSIRCYHADVADSARMREVFDEIAGSGHPLKGIIHAAGVLETGPLAQTDWPTFWSVLSPKVAGATVLKTLTQDLNLDFLAFFSSANTLVTEPGTAAYCAANTFLDSAAQAIRREGRPACSINWGEWLDVGMAKTVRSRRKLRRGAIDIPTLSPAEGLVALEMILSGGAAQCGVLPLDLEAARGLHSLPAVLRPLFSGLRSQGDAAKPASADFSARLLALSAADRETAVAGHLRETIAATLGVSEAQIPADASLTELDMDSLVVMETLSALKQSLGLMIYPREIYEHGSVAKLASYIAAEFERARGLRPTAGTPVSAAREKELQQALHATVVPVTQRNAPMVFLLSAPRSGSTLLRVMLAGHSRLFSPPELHLLPFATMAERARKLGMTYFSEGFQRAVMELRGASAEAVKQAIDAMEANDEPVQSVYALLQREAAPRLLVDKTPAYAASMDVLLKAEAMFDGARYLCLVRHPVAVIESFVRMRFSQLVGAADVDPYHLAEEIWFRSYSNIRDLGRRVGAGRFLLVRYEDLVRRSAEEARRICDFLGIPFEEALLHPYTGARMHDGVHHESTPLNDPNFLNHREIDGELADRWKSVSLPRPLAEPTCRLATEFGYELNGNVPTPHSDRPTWVDRTILLRSGEHTLVCWGKADRPMVLLVHGLLEHGAAWELVSRRLADMGYRPIAPDLRGHGRSAHTPPGVLYHPLDFLGDLDELLRLEAHAPVTLVGHSMGAALAALLATARPQLVRSLVLVEPPVEAPVRNGDAGELLAVQLDYLASPPRPRTFASVKEAAARLCEGFHSLDRHLAERMAGRLIEPAPEGVRWRWDPRLAARAGIGFGSFGGAEPAALLRSLEKLEGQVALVYGESSNLLRPEDVLLQQQALPRARRFKLAGGHNLHYDSPAALAGIIAEAAAGFSSGSTYETALERCG